MGTEIDKGSRGSLDSVTSHSCPALYQNKMSFGLSVGDILTGIQLCKWLYDTCFDKNNSAGQLLSMNWKPGA